MNVAYTEAGDPDDPDLVLLHGVNAAGSAGEWREVFDDLAAEHHVFAPDLPGFGRSDRPRYVTPRRCTRISSATSSPTSTSPPSSPRRCRRRTRPRRSTRRDRLRTASRSEGSSASVRRPSPDRARRSRGSGELIRAPLVGDALFNVIASKPSIRYFNADHGYDDPTNPSDEWTDYEWRTAHVENARFAPASFVSGYLNSDLDLAAALASMDAAPTIVWGARPM